MRLFRHLRRCVPELFELGRAFFQTKESQKTADEVTQLVATPDAAFYEDLAAWCGHQPTSANLLKNRLAHPLLLCWIAPQISRMMPPAPEGYRWRIHALHLTPHAALKPDAPLTLQISPNQEEFDSSSFEMHVSLKSDTSQILEMILQVYAQPIKEELSTQNDHDTLISPALPEQIPLSVREVAWISLKASAATEFSCLQRDPKAIAQDIFATGKQAIYQSEQGPELHPFGLLARVIAATAHLYGSAEVLQTLSAHFFKPVYLPHEIGIYLDSDSFYVGEGRGGPCILRGQFISRTELPE